MYIQSEKKWDFPYKTCGMRQVTGIDFNESFAPVMNDVGFRIMPIAKFFWI
jgi:hypothetical protein